MRDPARHLPADERRNVTVETVVALAAEQNPSDITTAAIAQRMGVTQGALFRHFPSKDAILEATMGWVADRLLAKMERAANGKPDPLAALEAMFMAHAGFVCDHPGVPRMILGELQRPGDTLPKRMVQGLIQRYGQLVRKQLAAGKAQGMLPQGLDESAAASLFIGSVQGLVMQSLMAGHVAGIRRAAPGVFAIYRRGITGAP
jgi:AcrR family transcriptional regulator